MISRLKSPWFVGSALAVLFVVSGALWLRDGTDSSKSSPLLLEFATSNPKPKPRVLPPGISAVNIKLKPNQVALVVGSQLCADGGEALGNDLPDRGVALGLSNTRTKAATATLTCLRPESAYAVIAFDERNGEDFEDNLERLIARMFDQPYCGVQSCTTVLLAYGEYNGAKYEVEVLGPVGRKVFDR